MTDVAIVIGLVVMVAGGAILATIIFGAAFWVLGFVMAHVGKRLTRVYDLYVVEWWISIATERGRKIPRRRDIEARLDEMKREE